ncbi:MAG TPA: hypothetical protein VD816_03525 [Ohtaekwangia sp.]|nr:hypothetical protein [Ohtaekwangia sp.]
MTRYIFILLLLIGAAVSAKAQHFVVSLSPKHQHKLASIDDGRKRMLKFYRFLKKDSVRERRRIDRYYEKQLDSIWQVEKVGGSTRLTRNGVSENSLFKLRARIDSLEKGLTNRTVIDGLDTERKRNLELPMQRVSRTNEPTPSDFGDIQQAVTLTPASRPELSREGERTHGLNPVRKGNPIDSATVKTSLERLKQQARDHFMEHPEAFGSAQQKIQKILSRYRDFSNSTNLKSAIRQTSLKGKVWTERLAIASGLNIVRASPLSLDISPSIGYRLNTKWTMGAGFRHRFSTGDSIQGGLSARGTAIKVFTQIDLWSTVYAQCEWEHTRVYSDIKENRSGAWKNSCFVGAGKRMLIHPKVYLTLTVLYNLSPDDGNASYPGRFVIRPGFQLGELAVRKRQVNYNPNR